MRFKMKFLFFCLLMVLPLFASRQPPGWRRKQRNVGYQEMVLDESGKRDLQGTPKQDDFAGLGRKKDSKTRFTMSPTSKPARQRTSPPSTEQKMEEAPPPTVRPSMSPTLSREDSPNFTESPSQSAENQGLSGSTVQEPTTSTSDTLDPASESMEETVLPTFYPTETASDSPTSSLATTAPPWSPVPLTPLPTISNSTSQPAASTPAPQPPTSPSCEVDEVMAVLEALDPAFATMTMPGDPSSYQCRSWQRVAEQNGYESFDLGTMLKYWCLYCIYFSTGGSLTWINTNGWRESDLDPCSGWFGISCDSLGRVVGIHLPRNGLTGTFPAEIRFLTSANSLATGAGNLQRLEIFNNDQLKNDAREEWISDLNPSLRVLNYASTQFGGPVPKLPRSLEEYDCSYANHTGEIKASSFEGLDNLKLLVMDGNHFDSSVPSAMAGLSSLRYFHIRDASLSGDLSYLHGMPSIVEHLVDGNPMITGSIPSRLGELTTLQSLSLSDCGLTGTLPSELARLTDMVQLWLHGNPLTGSIPSEYARMTELRILALEDTDITGVVPIELCLQRYNGVLGTLSVDCNSKVQCTNFFPDCCTCCGRAICGT